jgi:hypothetical protein
MFINRLINFTEQNVHLGDQNVLHRKLALICPETLTRWAIEKLYRLPRSQQV